MDVSIVQASCGADCEPGKPGKIRDNITGQTAMESDLCDPVFVRDPAGSSSDQKSGLFATGM
jgi:hypothetical protein